MFDRIGGHLARLGGVIVHPRATLSRVIVEREGSLLELLPWIAIVAMSIEPVRSGQALLTMRTNFADGLTMLASVISSRMAPAMSGVLGAAILLFAAEHLRRRGRLRHGFDAALDVSAFTIVPYLVIASIGRGLAMFGLDVWWLPHHPLRGSFADRALEVAAGFGWSIVLFLVAAVLFFQREPVADGG